MRVCDFCMKPGKLKDVILPVIERQTAECNGKQLGIIAEKLDLSRMEICTTCLENLARMIEDWKYDLQQEIKKYD